MTQATVLPVNSVAPRDWWRRLSTAVNLMLGQVQDLYTRPSGTASAGTYAVTSSDYAIWADATAGNVTITLPSPQRGRQLVVKRIDSSGNSVTLNGTVDGASSLSIPTQWAAYTLMGNGTGWYVI